MRFAVHLLSITVLRRMLSPGIGTGAIGSLWGVAAVLDVLPEGLTQADVLTAVLALTGIGSVVFRKTVKALQ